MSRKGNRLKPRNWGFNTTDIGQSTNFGVKRGNPQEVAKDLRNYISPVQLTRLRTDVSMWRDAVAEAERAYYPFRVKMQRIFIDTILNGHVYGLMQRRKDLTMLRNFSICDAKGNTSEDLTQQVNEWDWFNDFVSYSLDALFFGYSLISLGDVVNSEMQECSIVPRWFISPDRHEVGSFIYSTAGKDFRQSPQSDWHIYVKTASDNGASPCGYGLFYNIALYEIFLRNTLGFNGDFIELYAMPYRVGKTTKTTEAERAELEAAVRNMGSAGYALIDPQDDITFLETSLAGTGWEGYENLEQRCEKKISKIILGHADAIDSTPGKLGSGQGGKSGSPEPTNSPVQQALADKQTKDGRFIENIINRQLLPRLRNINVKDYLIPEGYVFKYLNDGEEDELRNKEDQSNLVTAQIAQTMKNAGLQMDAAYFTERTGIPSKKIQPPAPLKNPITNENDDLRNTDKVKNKLKILYS